MAWNHTLLRAGEFKLDAGCMFGLIPRVVWTRWLTPDENNRMTMQQNCLLLEGHGKRVLIETGIGDKFGDKERAMYQMDDRAVHDCLDEVGCDPKDIDAVVLTHLHFDHAGGLTRRNPKGPDHREILTFPNAEIIVQEQEWHDAIDNKSTMNKTYLRNHLNDEVAERLRLVDGEAEIFAGMHVFPTPGHTWGQQSIRFQRELVGGKAVPDAVYVSDVIPTRYHAKPTTNLSYDVEPYTSMLSRQELLLDAAKHQWLLLPNHEAGHPTFVAKHNDDKPGTHELVEAE